MVNPLFLPELREMLSDNDRNGMREFCEAFHPARAAEFMEGLDGPEAWQVLSQSDIAHRVEVFHYLPRELQQQIIEQVDRADAAQLVSHLAHDDRVDLLKAMPQTVVEELLPLLPKEERRDILHLGGYPEGTAGSLMTSEVAKLPEHLTVREALDHVQRISEEFETIYYLYIVDQEDRLRGLVSFRELIQSMKTPHVRLSDIMETALVSVNVLDDQEEVARQVARYDFLAIPVVDEQHKLLGIITYDDVIDVVREEATEDAHRIAAVEPLSDSYLRTSLLTLAWKRGIWLTILFIGAVATAFALEFYEQSLATWRWLVAFIPLVISSGGNTGNQSATLVITGLTTGEIQPRDWGRVLRREAVMGLVLGSCLGLCGMIAACLISQEAWDWRAVWVVPLTITTVVTCGSLIGSFLPMIFKRLGLDPALMSNPFVAGIIDILGIVIYLNIAGFLLS